MKKIIKFKIAISAAVAVISLASTPFIFKLAETERGYKAYGGEMFMPVITAISILFMIEGILQLKSK